MDAILVNVKAAKVDVLTSPGTSRMFGLETMFHLQGEHFSDTYDMFCQGTAVNHNIMKVYDDEFAFHWYQGAIQHVYELAQCICQAKLQELPLVQSNFSGEGHLVPVSYSDANLMVTGHQVQFCEPTGAVHRVE